MQTRPWGVINSFLTFPLGLLASEPGAVSDKYGKRFHQDISTMEKSYAVKVVTEHDYTIVDSSKM